MAFTRIEPNPYPYEALRIYFASGRTHLLYYDRKQREPEPQSNEAHKTYLVEKAREFLKQNYPQWTRAEILVVHGNKKDETVLFDTLYPKK